jgi:uncharacterized 2Fe-2S/4Fe-4S cluster protein (DUF4445 family)
MDSSDQTLHGKHQVIFMPSGRRGLVADGVRVLDAARQLGVEIESICGGRLTCNKCLIKVEEGSFQKHNIISAANHLSPTGRDEQITLERLDKKGCRLSCTAQVEGDVLLFVPEESRGHKQIIRKSATERVIEIDPAVRQVYVEVDQAELGQHRGDWGRVQDALADQWDLVDLDIDLLVLRRLQAALRKGNWTVIYNLATPKEFMDWPSILGARQLQVTFVICAPEISWLRSR